LFGFYFKILNPGFDDRQGFIFPNFFVLILIFSSIFFREPKFLGIFLINFSRWLRPEQLRKVDENPLVPKYLIMEAAMAKIWDAEEPTAEFGKVYPEVRSGGGRWEREEREKGGGGERGRGKGGQRENI
jgi:hypothetical protein